MKRDRAEVDAELLERLRLSLLPTVKSKALRPASPPPAVPSALSVARSRLRHKPAGRVEHVVKACLPRMYQPSPPPTVLVLDLSLGNAVDASLILTCNERSALASTKVFVLGVERHEKVYDKTAQALAWHFESRETLLKEAGQPLVHKHKPADRLKVLLADSANVLSRIVASRGGGGGAPTPGTAGGLEKATKEEEEGHKDIDEALKWAFEQRGAPVVDVIYIDVMFAEKRRRGKAKAGIESLRRTLATPPVDYDSEEERNAEVILEDGTLDGEALEKTEQEGKALLMLAKTVLQAQAKEGEAEGKHPATRIVVKRKRNSPFLGDLTPNHSIGLSADVRFDIYIC